MTSRVRRAARAPSTSSTRASASRPRRPSRPPSTTRRPPPRQVAQNIAAGRNPLGQVSGVSADRAWKYFGEAGAPAGDPDVEVAILDTGIRWNNPSCGPRWRSTRGSCRSRRSRAARPAAPTTATATAPSTSTTIADDPRVSASDGHPEADADLDPSDLIAAFSDGADGEGNGYADDIAGWDFFDDDNDPYDASSYSRPSTTAAGEPRRPPRRPTTATAASGCVPACQFVPLRVWDTFVVDTNNFAQGVLYAADNGIEVVEGAVGGLANTRFAREAFAHAYERGVFLALVSSDLNTANHNYPTNYDEAMFVGGTVADARPRSASPRSASRWGKSWTTSTITACPWRPPPRPATWFRNSGTTQYGGHAHVVMPAATGSEATGQASGAAGARRQLRAPTCQRGRARGRHAGAERDQAAADPDRRGRSSLNTDGAGVADPAQVGWEQHFGYGRPDLGLALQRVRSRSHPAAGADHRRPTGSRR